MGRHVAPRHRRGGRAGRLGEAGRAGIALVAVSALSAVTALTVPLSLPLSAQATVLSHGGGLNPGGEGGGSSFGAGIGSGFGPGGVPQSTGAVTAAGAAIVRVAWAQLGRGLDGPNTINGADFGGSSALPSAWCAAFAAWVWSSAGVSTVGLNGWAGSFLEYGVQNRTLHTGAPRVGDAALFALSGGVAQASASGTLANPDRIEHVGIVVAVTPTTVTVVNGDWGDGRGGPQLVRMSAYSTSTDAPSYVPSMRQYLAGYVDPVRG